MEPFIATNIGLFIYHPHETAIFRQENIRSEPVPESPGPAPIHSIRLPAAKEAPPLYMEPATPSKEAIPLYPNSEK